MSATPANERWFEAAFRAEYLRVYPHRDVAAARREVEFLLAHGVRGRVLDLCCGFGRHTLLLRTAGIDAYGVDLSMDLLLAARELPGFAERLAGRLVRGDAERVPLRSGRFDAVLNLFSSFGYFGPDDAGGDGRVLDEISRLLVPRGLVVLDLMNAPRVRATLVPFSRRETPEFTLEERRELTDGGRRVVKAVDLAFADGRRFAWREDVRLYSLAELETLLLAHGFACEATYGDFDASACDERSARALVFARRR